MPDHAGKPPALDLDSALCIVVGAHPRAEVFDRPTAYALRDRAASVLASLPRESDDPPLLTPMLVSDIWYLNDDSLRQRATISVGAPGVNALTASLIDRLPSAFVVDDVLSVQLDLEMTDLVATCWGVTPNATRTAAETFAERYLQAFLAAAVGRWGLRVPT